VGDQGNSGECSMSETRKEIIRLKKLLSVEQNKFYDSGMTDDDAIATNMLCGELRRAIRRMQSK
jgi:hypothetical protein